MHDIESQNIERTKYRKSKISKWQNTEANISMWQNIEETKYRKHKISKVNISKWQNIEVVKYQNCEISEAKYRTQNNNNAKHRKLKLKSPCTRITKMLYCDCKTPSREPR